MEIIAVANQKGGVGKTTTAINLLAALALAGRRCLLVDLDAQANATTGLGIEKVDAHRLEEGLPEPVKTGHEGLDVVPASAMYATRAAASALGKGIESSMPDGYDFAALDCPPALTGVTRAALNIANSIVVPIQCEYFSLEGLDAVLRAIQAAKRQQNPGVELLGILLTMYEPDEAYCEAVVDEVRSHFPDDTLETVIPRDMSLSEAAGHGVPISIYDPRSPGSFGYVKLAKEVLNARKG